MSIVSKIEWTEATWNPVTGCTKISKGCQNCYAATLAKRLKAMGNKRYINEFDVTVHEDLIDKPDRKGLLNYLVGLTGQITYGWALLLKMTITLRDVIC